MAGPVTVVVVFTTFRPPPVILAYPLLDDSSDLVPGLAPVDEDIHLAKRDAILEVQLLLRDSSALILDVLLFAVSHSSFKFVFYFINVIFPD